MTAILRNRKFRIGEGTTVIEGIHKEELQDRRGNQKEKSQDWRVNHKEELQNRRGYHEEEVRSDSVKSKSVIAIVPASLGRQIVIFSPFSEFCAKTVP